MTTQEPSDAAQLLKQAQASFDKRDWISARDAYEAILVLQPSNALALVQLSRAEVALGHYRAGHKYALRASELEIKDPELAASLMSRLRTFCEYRAIDKLIRRLPPKHQISIPGLMALSVELHHHGDPDLALEYVQEAMRGDPNYPPTLMAMGNLLTNFGKFAEAERYLDRTIQLAPGMSFAYWLLSKLRKQTPEANHVRLIVRLLSGGKEVTAENQSLLYYALHKELDDLGDYPAAWEALMRACKAKRSQLKYSKDDGRALVDGLIDWSANASAAAPVARTPVDAPTPLFIVGMHRSGTTLLEQLLDGHPDVNGSGELYDFTSQMRYATDTPCSGPIDEAIVRRAVNVDFGEVGARYLDVAAWRVGKLAFHTDKLPSNFLNIGFICHALPQAKILHMVRDPLETCFSNLRELFSDVNPYSYDQAELADWFLQYRRLMAHWHATFPGRILDVSYADLTRDTEAVMRKVAAFCGLDYVPAMSDPRSSTRAVSTASVVQVRGNVVAREVPKWAPYEQQLQPLIAALRAGGVKV